MQNINKNSIIYFCTCLVGVYFHISFSVLKYLSIKEGLDPHFHKLKSLSPRNALHWNFPFCSWDEDENVQVYRWTKKKGRESDAGQADQKGSRELKHNTIQNFKKCFHSLFDKV